MSWVVALKMLFLSCQLSFPSPLPTAQVSNLCSSIGFLAKRTRGGCSAT